VIPWYDRLTQPKIETGVGVWAEKLNMTTIFEPDGKQVPATILVVKRGGNLVTNKKWPERHGVYQVEVGYQRYVAQDHELKNTSNRGGTKINRLAAADLPPLQKIKSFSCRPQEWTKYEVGQKISISEHFKEGDVIDIHGVAKEMGFGSSIKRWPSHGRGPMTHGSKHHRRVGSLGPGTGTGRIFPGRKMPGHMGGFPMKQTTQILKIIDNIDEDNMPETMIVVKGNVPGFTAHWKEGGSFVYFHHRAVKGDGRFKRDPVWMWYVQDEKDDPYVPIPSHAWTMKSYWGRDMRWLSDEKWKYWPDGFPGYDHSHDPFFEDCDPRKAVKAPEW
jgi:large subunit ribosomal protein L3